MGGLPHPAAAKAIAGCVPGRRCMIAYSLADEWGLSPGHGLLENLRRSAEMQEGVAYQWRTMDGFAGMELVPAPPRTEADLWR